MDKRSSFISLNRGTRSAHRTGTGIGSGHPPDRRSPPATPDAVLPRIDEDTVLNPRAEPLAEVRPEGEPFSITLQGDRHATMAVPPNWQLPMLLGAVTEGRLGVGQAWFESDGLHLTGPAAADTLRRLTDALLVLNELGVGSRPGLGVLDVLVKAPSLMSAPTRGVRLVALDGQTRIAGDAQWALTVLVDLAAGSPTLACAFMGRLTPRMQQALLGRCPSAIHTVVARLSEARDRRAWIECLEAGLGRALRTRAEGRDVLAWIAGCPPWAAGALHRQWTACEDAAAKAWCLRSCPPLAEALARLAEAADLAASGMGRGPQPRPTWGTLTVGLEQPPAQVLAALRVHEEPPEGSVWWNLGVGFLRRRAGQIVSGEAEHPEGCLACYQDVVEASRLLLKQGTATLRLHAVCSEVAALYADKRVDDQRLAWLLGQLYRNAQASFAHAVGHAFRQHCAAPASSRLVLEAAGAGERAHVDLQDNVHLRWLLAALVLTACADPAFQASLPLDARKSLQALLGPLEPPLVQRLAPDGLEKAPWRVQYLWRGELASDDQDFALTSQVFAGILRKAVHGEHPIRPEEINELAAQIAGAQQHDDLIAWTSLLLAQFPADQDYQHCVAKMLVNTACRLLEASPGQWPWADRFLSLLCRADTVWIARLQDAKPHAISSRLCCTETLIRVQRLLSGRKEKRAQQRVCAWMAQLLVSVGSLATDETRDLAAYIFTLQRSHGLDLLNADERGVVAIYLNSHQSPAWRGSYT